MNKKEHSDSYFCFFIQKALECQLTDEIKIGSDDTGLRHLILQKVDETNKCLEIQLLTKKEHAATEEAEGKGRSG